MNSFTGIFQQRFKLPMLPSYIDSSPHPPPPLCHQILKSPPPMFLTPVGNPVGFSENVNQHCKYELQFNTLCTTLLGTKVIHHVTNTTTFQMKWSSTTHSPLLLLNTCCNLILKTLWSSDSNQITVPYSTSVNPFGVRSPLLRAVVSNYFL